MCNLFILWPPLKWEMKPREAKKKKKSVGERYSLLRSVTRYLLAGSAVLPYGSLTKKRDWNSWNGDFPPQRIRRPAFSNCMRPQSETFCSVWWNCGTGRYTCAILSTGWRCGAVLKVLLKNKTTCVNDIRVQVPLRPTVHPAAPCTGSKRSYSVCLVSCLLCLLLISEYTRWTEDI